MTICPKNGPVENVELEVLLHYARRFFVYNLNSRCFVRVPDAGSVNLVAAFTSAIPGQPRLLVRRCYTGVVLVFILGSIERAMPTCPPKYTHGSEQHWDTDRRIFVQQSEI